jgi:hypothetical protein
MRFALLTLLLVMVSANAENIIIPLGQQNDPSVQKPANGTSKRSVLERFGLPDVEHPPIGSPGMTRRDYRDFSVYLENAIVITSVRHDQAKYPKQVQP